MDMTLYEIQSNYLELLEEIERNGGEVTPVQEAALAINESDMFEKLNAYGRVISDLLSLAETCDAEVARLAAKAVKARKHADRLQERIKEFLITTGRKTAQGGLWTYSVRQYSVVNVEDIEALPAEYWRVSEKRFPNKKMIKEAITAGATVPGARMGQVSRLQVK